MTTTQQKSSVAHFQVHVGRIGPMSWTHLSPGSVLVSLGLRPSSGSSSSMPVMARQSTTLGRLAAETGALVPI
jgi:hypothetical protein